MSPVCNIAKPRLKLSVLLDVYQCLQQLKIKLTFRRGKLLLSLTPFLTPSSCLLSFLLRSQISMCVAHSISCKQLTQVDPSGMVRSQTHILLDKACPLSCHGLKQTGKHTYRRVHTHTLNVCYVCLCGIVKIRPHVERLIHFHCVSLCVCVWEPWSWAVHCCFL